MAAHKKPRRFEAQLAFESLSIEGGVLSPDWLSRAAQLAAGQQSEADYRIPKGLNLRDEIGRYWRIAQAHWAEFLSGRAGTAEPRFLAERFALALLRDCFGFTSLAALEPITISGRVYPIGFSSLGRRAPVIIAPAAIGLDTPILEFGDGTRRRSAFGLAQEYLNAAEEAQWGIASDGVTLRIARDNASLTRPAWIEADLLRMFTEGRYADFAALWLIAHETRFGRADQAVGESALETWRKAGQEEGTRIRGKLEQAFEDAVRDLGQGFLAHPDNQAIRATLQDGSLSTSDYFNQLLRLVYRLIFLLTVEERGLLHADSTPDDARSIYAEGYSVKRLRERCLKRSAHDRFSDLWESMKIVFRGLAVGEPRLGMPALAGIFAGAQCPALDGARLENRALLLAMFRLSWLRESSGLSRVNWRDMGPEELGSVYETLLELVPQVTTDGRQFAFASGSEAKGNARKTSGSYYTPDSLVQVLLDSALEPVIADTIAKHPSNPVDALLGLSIVDPACGSGHFLLGAARRLAAHVARLLVAGTPSAQEFRRALRQVVGRCVFGVDLNPMAVELCKVSLWMEAVEPGLPLTFLDSHIQQGDSLLGTTPELMDGGIPDAAWDPIEGDDTKTASALKKRNKIERTDTNTSFEFSAVAEGGTIAIVSQVQALDAASDKQLGELERKQATWEALLVSTQYRARQLAADTWCAAFMWPKKPGDLATLAPTHQTFERLRHDPQSAAPKLVAEVQALARQFHFFHWHLAFPQVFAKGGFDVVLGNPPWERVKLLEAEFFAGRNDDIAAASNAAQRGRRIAELQQTDEVLFAEFVRAKRQADGIGFFAQHSGRYPLTACGDINTYALFSETNRNLIGPSGAAGFIVQSDIATSDTYKAFFSDLLAREQLVSLHDFVNTENIFPGVHRTHPHFCLVTLGSAGKHSRADFSFWNTNAGHLKDPHRHFALSRAELELLNPETGTCPVFRSTRDADLTKRICSRFPPLCAQDVDGGWRTSVFQKMFDATIHSAIIRFTSERPAGDFCPVYEGKTIRHFNHRATTYAGVSVADCEAGNPRSTEGAELQDPFFTAVTRYWVSANDFRERLGSRAGERHWFPGYRYKTNTTNRRTMIVAVRPWVPSVNTLTSLFMEGDASEQACFVAALGSFVSDYVVRQKMGGTTLGEYILRQLPIPERSDLAASGPDGQPLKSWIATRVLELTYTTWDLESFARDLGYTGPPYRWNSERRFILSAELDAALFVLYGLGPDEVDYVMETFPIVRKNDEKEFGGQYRTKETILSIYDELVGASRKGKLYKTRLDPPPADRRVAHPPRETKIVPLPRRPPMRPPIPVWGRDIITAVAERTGVASKPGNWSTSMSGQLLGTAALAAVLRQQAEPSSREQVERTVVLALLPRLMRPQFDAASAKRWKSLVGKGDLGIKSVVSFAVPWKDVVRAAIQQKVLVEDSMGRWSVGPDIDDVPTSALDARALVALSWMASAPAEDAAVTQELEVLRAA